VQECYEKDMSLVKRGMEQASVARIIYYMQTLINTDDRYERLREYIVDCEYYRNNDDLKRTPRCQKGTKPDLLLHKREKNTGNLMVVEFKSRKNNGKKYQETNQYMDEIKLEDFTSSDCFNYQLGVWVKLKLSEPKYTFFKNGHQL
ncbi:MAG: hypothetical protein IJG75_00425, partial [Spirochaetia bacterium]|nr:hypothetical protein [Spirochaetia bacterium]